MRTISSDSLKRAQMLYDYKLYSVKQIRTFSKYAWKTSEELSVKYGGSRVGYWVDMMLSNLRYGAMHCRDYVEFEFFRKNGREKNKFFTLRRYFNLIKHFDKETFFSLIDKEMAQCIYTGIMTDTGALSYNSNSSNLFQVVSHLLDKGVDKDEIYRLVYNNYSESRLRLQGFVLNEKMQVFPDKSTSLITLTDKELRKFKYRKGDTEGFVNMPLQINGVLMSAFFREDKEQGIIKLSSIDLDALEHGEATLASNFHLLQFVAIEHGNIFGNRRASSGSKLYAVNTGRNSKLGIAIGHG